MGVGDCGDLLVEKGRLFGELELLRRAGFFVCGGGVVQGRPKAR